MNNNRLTIPQSVEPPENVDGELEQETRMPEQEYGQEMEPEEKPRRRTNDLSDLFEVPQPEDNDIYTDDLVELDSEDVYGGDEDMSDILEVSHEDIMGKPLQSRRNRRVKRTQRSHNTLTSMGGMQI